MKKKPSGRTIPFSPALFDMKELVSDVQLARIPDHAEVFTVPLRPVSVAMIQKPRKGGWGEIFAEPLKGLNLQRQTTEVSRAWLLRAESYLNSGVKDKGQMQADLTKAWPDFRPYLVKVQREDEARSA